MSSRLLIPASEISTHFRCDYCGISIGKVSWLQCEVCKAFDLCGKCANDPAALSSRKVCDHKNSHANVSVNNDCIKPTSVVEAETSRSQVRMNLRQQKFESIVNNNKIRNDYEMAIVMDKLKHTGLQSSSSSSKEDSLNSLVVKYHLEANERSINVLCLDGGGVRGYMPIKVLGEFITQKYLPDIETLDQKNLQHKDLFYKGQLEFTKQFDYFAGTSTGGIIAFCLAIGYNILDVQEIYAESPKYFKKNSIIPFLPPVASAKYNPEAIHGKIDEIINSLTFPGDKKKSAENATLLDLRNLLNPHKIIDEKDAEEYSSKYGNLLEFVDKKNSGKARTLHEQSDFYQTPREKVLLITAYNTTYNMITIFNTSYSEHWGYLIADVIKSTMAAPTYFPPKNAYKGNYKDGRFQKGETVETFIDGGVFANDPELAALWAIRMQWKKPLKYHILSIGTGIYKSTLPSDTWGGYWGWILKGAILIDTLMGAPGSFTEVVGGNLAKFNNMRRMKLNYKLKESMNLDDPNFVDLFKNEWEYLKNEDDYKAFVYFYEKYIENDNQF